jgi:hypothetical protein
VEYFLRIFFGKFRSVHRILDGLSYTYFDLIDIALGSTNLVSTQRFMELSMILVTNLFSSDDKQKLLEIVVL